MRETSYKLTVPRVGEHIRRGDLLRRLDDAQKQAALTWVVGLPASGKTSLVARWVEDRPTIWYRLDENDADVAPFLDAVAQQADVPLPTWSPENDLADFARRFFGELARAGHALVLDDCHRIPDDAPLFAMLGLFHESSGRAVLVSRRAPPPVLARGRIGGWLEILDDLRLSADEARAVVEAVRGTSMSANEAESLASADGWLAQVLTVARQRESSVRLAHATAVGEYLAAELLASLPKAQRAAFRRLAELPEIPRDLPVAPEVLRIFCALSQEDWPRAQEYLQQLARTERTHKRLDAMVHHFFRSWYSLCRGDPRTALAHAETA